MTFAKFPHSAGTKTVPLADARARAGGGDAAALGVADCLSLAAAPTFTIMALVTGVLGGGPMDALCSSAQDASRLSGMVMMYLLMSASHSAPWLKLISSRRSGKAVQVSAAVSLRNAACRWRIFPAFKASTGSTPHRWLEMRRIDIARDLLASRAPLAEIAITSGFADQSHLTRIFKRMTGTTPAAWRVALTTCPGADGWLRGARDSATIGGVAVARRRIAF